MWSFCFVLKLKTLEFSLNTGTSTGTYEQNRKQSYKNADDFTKNENFDGK